MHGHREANCFKAIRRINRDPLDKGSSDKCYLYADFDCSPNQMTVKDLFRRWQAKQAALHFGFCRFSFLNFTFGLHDDFHLK